MINTSSKSRGSISLGGRCATIPDLKENNTYPRPLLDKKFTMRKNLAGNSNNLLASKYKFSSQSLATVVDCQTMSAMDIDPDYYEDITNFSEFVPLESCCSLLSLSTSRDEDNLYGIIKEQQIEREGQIWKRGCQSEDNSRIILGVSQLFCGMLINSQKNTNKESQYSTSDRELELGDNMKDDRNLIEKHQNTFITRKVSRKIQCDLRESKNCETSTLCDKIASINRIGIICDNSNLMSLFTGLERMLTFPVSQSLFKKTFSDQKKRVEDLKSGELRSSLSIELKLDTKLRLRSLHLHPTEPDLLVSIEYDDLRSNRNESKYSSKISIWDIKLPQQDLCRITLPFRVIGLDFSKSKPNIFSIGTECGKVITYELVKNLNRKDEDSDDSKINIESTDSMQKPNLYNFIRKSQTNFAQISICSLEYSQVKEPNGVEKEVIRICLTSGRIFMIDCDKPRQNFEILALSRPTDRVPHLRPGNSSRITYGRAGKDQNEKEALLIPLEDVDVNQGTLSRLCYPLSMNSCFADPNMYLVGCRNGFVFLCNTNSAEAPIDYKYAHEGPVIECKFQPGGTNTSIFASCSPNQVRIWSWESQQALMTFDFEDSDVIDICWVPFDDRLLAILTSKSVQIFDTTVQNRGSVMNIEAFKTNFQSMIISREYPIVFVGHEDKKVAMHRISTSSGY
ncbi:MAG: WD repeat-containing protein 78 [Marteilia pararefringens]